MLARLIRRIDESPWLFHLVNIAVAAIWIYFASRQVALLQSLPSNVENAFEQHTIPILRIVMNSLLVLFYVLRRRSKDVATDALSIGLGHLGTWLPLAFGVGRPPRWDDALRQWADAPDPRLQRVCLVVMVVTCALSTLGFAALGRSWGIIPANRGVKTGGLYRVVRHPIYASYIVFYAAQAAATSSTAQDVLILVAFACVQAARAQREELVLRRDPAYAAYAERTRFMLVPGVI